jgi:hypothetical protein
VHGPETAQGQVYGVVDEIARRVLLTGGTVLSVDAAGVPGGRGLRGDPALPLVAPEQGRAVANSEQHIGVKAMLIAPDAEGRAHAVSVCLPTPENPLG